MFLQNLIKPIKYIEKFYQYQEWFKQLSKTDIFIWINIYILMFIFGVVTFTLLIKFSHQYNLLDNPDNERKRHKIPIPVIGGIGIFLTFLLGSCVTFLLLNKEPTHSFYLFCLGLFFMLVLGFIDDMKGLTAKNKLSFQFLIVFFVLFALTYIYDTKLLQVLVFENNSIITFVFLIGISFVLSILLNIFNIIDGLDGLLGGISLLNLTSVLVISVAQSNNNITQYTLLFMVSIIVFLMFNLPPAKTFLGDGGSLMLGFVIIFLTMGLFDNFGMKNIVLSLLIIGYPLIDTINVVFRRIKNGKSILVGDRQHIHHLFLDSGYSSKQTLIFILSFNAFIQILSITFYFSNF